MIVYSLDILLFQFGTSLVPCLVLTVVSWPASGFLKRQVRWSVIPPVFRSVFQNFPQFIVFHTVKEFGIVNKAEIDVFLELSCFFNDLADVGNLISGSSAFSKTSLNIWKLFTLKIFPFYYIDNLLISILSYGVNYLVSPTVTNTGIVSDILLLLAKLQWISLNLFHFTLQRVSL